MTMQVERSFVGKSATISLPNHSITSVRRGAVIPVLIEQVEEGIVVAALKLDGRVLRGVLLDSEKWRTDRQLQLAQEQASLASSKKAGLQRAPNDVVSVVDRRECDLSPDVDQTPPVVLMGVNKRGRPCAWKHLHPGRGVCRECVLCKRSSPQGRYTHPALWRQGERDKLERFGIELSSCICMACHMSKIKTGLLFKNMSLAPHVKPTVVGLTGKRGRPYSWQLVHPLTGVCKRCQLCGRSSWQQRYTHPTNWRQELQSEAVRFGLGLESCVCRMCYVSVFRSGKSVLVTDSNHRVVKDEPVAQDDIVETEMMDQSVMSDSNASQTANCDSNGEDNLLEVHGRNHQLHGGSPLPAHNENLLEAQDEAPLQICNGTHPQAWDETPQQACDGTPLQVRDGTPQALDTKPLIALNNSPFQGHGKKLFGAEENNPLEACTESPRETNVKNSATMVIQQVKNSAALVSRPNLLETKLENSEPVLANQPVKNLPLPVSRLVKDLSAPVMKDRIALSSPVCVVSENLTQSRQPRALLKCALPDCGAEVYAHLGHATAATVAAIMGVTEDELMNVTNNRVPLCTTHYRSVWRVLRMMPCLSCNVKGPPEMQRQFRSNAEQLGSYLDQAGIKHNITAASACCTRCYREQLDRIRGDSRQVAV